MAVEICLIFYCFSLWVPSAPRVPRFNEMSGPCETVHGRHGMYKPLSQCPPLLRTFLKNGGSRRRINTVVCCETKSTTHSPPNNLPEGNPKTDLRPADRACSTFNSHWKSLVLNGEQAQRHDFPYMAALGYDFGENSNEIITYDCGGTLISPTHVLTAAHCLLRSDEKRPIMVRLGSVSLNEPDPDAQRISIAKTIIHPSYRRSLGYNDVGLLRLEKPADLSMNVKPICLQTEKLPDSQINGKPSIFLIGFGSTEIFGARSNELMKTANLDLIPTDKCSKSYEDESFLCTIHITDEQRSDACHGDSGGPLLMITNSTETIIGVTSIGQSCGSAAPGIAMSVLSFLDWIESEVWPDG